jgi:hypothetical protein
MNNSGNLITVSTDLGGVRLMNPALVQRFYEQAGFNCNLELILMPPVYPAFIALANGADLGFQLGGVHGKAGTDWNPLGHSKGLVDWAFIKVVDQLFPNISGIFKPGALTDSIATLTQAPIYYNVHNTAVAQDFASHQAFALAAKNAYLTIENGANPGDIQQVDSQVARLQDAGTEKTSGTFDVVHAISAFSDGALDIKTVTRYWNRVMESMNFKYYHQLHLPIGVSDCLPIAEMIKEKAMLTQLGQMIKERNMGITIENQDNLLMGSLNANRLERLKEIRAGLLECGFPV